NIPNGLIGECWISDSIFKVLEALEDMDETRKEAFLIWCDNGHRKLSEGDIDDLLSDFDDDYIGEYKDEEDFAYEQVEQMDLPEFAKTYFDYEAYARDLFSGDYCSDSGHVFYNSLIFGNGAPFPFLLKSGGQKDRSFRWSGPSFCGKRNNPFVKCFRSAVSYLHFPNRLYRA